MNDVERVKKAAEEYFDHDDWSIRILVHNDGDRSATAFHTKNGVSVSDKYPSIVHREIIFVHNDEVVKLEALKYAEDYVRGYPQEKEILDE